MRHPVEIGEVGAGGEDVGDDDRGKSLIAKRLRVFGLLGLVLTVLAVMRLERCVLLRGLKIELESLEGGRASVIAVETDEEI